MPPTLLDVCDRDHNGSVQLTGRRLHRLRKKSGFVSGYRFSDTVSPSKSDAPLGATQRQFTFSAACSAAGLQPRVYGSSLRTPSLDELYQTAQGYS
jgi:hypothetical protein